MFLPPEIIAGDTNGWISLDSLNLLLQALYIITKMKKKCTKINYMEDNISVVPIGQDFSHTVFTTVILIA